VAKWLPISAAAELLSFLICPQIIARYRFFWIGSKKDDFPWLASVFQVPFSALTLLVGGQEGHPAVKFCSIPRHCLSELNLGKNISLKKLKLVVAVVLQVIFVCFLSRCAQ